MVASALASPASASDSSSSGWTMAVLLEEVEARRRVAEILGTASERRALRTRLGLSLADVAAATGLSVAAVRRRELPSWKCMRGSLESEAGLAYVRFIAAAKGVQL